MTGCGCNNAIKIKERSIKEKKKAVGLQIKKDPITVGCLNYAGYQNKIRLISNITINYTEVFKFQYYRIVPNYFRYFESEFIGDSYDFEITQDTEQGRCLRAQLEAGPIRLWSLEEFFIKVVPAADDIPLLKLEKDLIRNQWFAFCLNIEKTFLYFNAGKLTCNNNFVPWQAYFGTALEGNNNISFLLANTVELTNYDQTIMYKLSNSFFLNFFEGSRSRPINYYNILRKALGLPIVGEETQINFYELIFITFVLLQDLFSISQTLLLGKDPGYPKEFIELYFPPDRQRYYYNLYLTWIETRNRNFGFGTRINAGNGSGTFIPIPGVNPNNLIP